MPTFTPRKPQQKPQQQRQKREYSAPQTVAMAMVTGFVRTEVQQKSFKNGEVTLSEFLISFGQRPDKDGNKSGSISVKAFGELGEYIAGNVTKGSKVQIIGNLTEEVWADKESGDRRSKHVIMADKLLILAVEREEETEEEETPY